MSYKHPIVPLPPNPALVKKGRSSNFPFANLMPGTCFYEPHEEHFASLRKAAYRWNRMHADRRVRVGIEGDRLRCWLDIETFAKGEDLPTTNPSKFEFIGYLTAQLNAGEECRMPVTFLLRFDQLRAWAFDWADTEKRKVNSRIENDGALVFFEKKEKK